MTYKCELFDQHAQPVLFVRTRTSVDNLPNTLGRYYQAIGEHLNSQNEEPGGAPYTAYYNMDMQDLDIEIGFPVSHALPGKDEIQSGEMPAGKYVSCLHKGPYLELKSAYDFVHEYIDQNHLQPTGVVYEFYLNAPNEVPQDELKTQILFQLKSE